MENLKAIFAENLTRLLLTLWDALYSAAVDFGEIARIIEYKCNCRRML